MQQVDYYVVFSFVHPSIQEKGIIKEMNQNACFMIVQHKNIA